MTNLQQCSYDSPYLKKNMSILINLWDNLSMLLFHVPTHLTASKHWLESLKLLQELRAPLKIIFMILLLFSEECSLFKSSHDASIFSRKREVHWFRNEAVTERMCICFTLQGLTDSNDLSQRHMEKHCFLSGFRL